jgi:DNA repair protein RecN (Recombination protein N)
MLQSFTVQNFALISNLEINFSDGFSVITGETGAGKSIILGALSLILGQRADAKAIRHGSDKCLIEGVFDISAYKLEQFFKEKDLEYDEHYCILRREIYSSGKSRSFINDSPVTLNDLKELGASLIDIHSQHQNLLLADNHFQLQVLDVMAGNRDLKNEYCAEYKNYVFLNKQVAELKENIAKKQTEEDYIKFQFNQLDEANLKAGEQASLEAEQETLLHVEEIKSALYRIENLLSADDSNVVSTLKEALTAAQNLHRIYAPADEIAERLKSAYLDMKDLAPEISARQENLEYQPKRLQEVTERLDLIYSLQQKHRLASVEALIELRDCLESQLNTINSFGELLEKLEKDRKDSFLKVEKLAGLLSDTRKKSALLLERQLIETVSQTGMPTMRFTVDFSVKTQPDTTGKDDVTFMFSANKNSELRPVANIASGGEISRLMLGVKALIAGAMSLPSIIFDEIDTGVSGEIADKMGSILHEMGKTMQVIAITHLPQIAARGNFQYLVYKEEYNNFTETRIRLLSEEERVTEIARILSGANLTDAALANAKSLLNK